MTPAEKEKFYDEKIAPELLKLGQLCQDNDLSMLATVEWAPESDSGKDTAGSTIVFYKDTSDSLRRAARVVRGEHIVDAVAITITKEK